MSERSRRVRRWTLAGIVAAAAASGAPGSLTGQVTEATLVDSIDALLPRVRALRAERAADREREARAAALRAPRVLLDTARVGPLTVVATSAHAPEAARVVAAAWESLPPLTAGTPLLDSAAVVFHRGGELGVSVGYPRLVRIEVGREVGGNETHERARRALQRAIVDALPTALTRWLRRQPLDRVMSGGEIARALLLSGSRAGRECALGDAGACRAALGLTGADDPVAAAWSASEGAVMRERGLDAWAGLARCEAARGGSCGSAGDGWERLLPAGPRIRADFLTTALAEGGPGALDRLVAAGWADPPPPEHPASGDPVARREYFRSAARIDWERSRPGHAGRFGPLLEERLAVATGRDPDALLKAWMAGFSQPGARRREDDGSRSSTLLWIVLFSALATGSTRWRLG